MVLDMGNNNNPRSTKRARKPARKTLLLVELLRDAHSHDRDMAGACSRRIASNLKAVRQTRRAARTSRSLRLREYFTKRAARTVRDNRRIRELAKAHGWVL